MRKKNINVSLTEEALSALRKIKDDTGAPVSEIIRRAVDAFLETYREKEVKTEVKPEIGK